jgi:hypothetical protein
MRTRALSATALAALFLGGPMANSAQAIATVPPLGTAAEFSVLAGSTVTNTGPTTLGGSVGVSPGSAITGSNTLTVGGATHSANAVAGQAQVDLTAAYDQAAGQTDAVQTIAPELGGLTLQPGVYRSQGEWGLTGQLNLNGSADSVWVFQTPSTLITAPAASITFSGGANACNVFWQVGSSATLDTGTIFAGTIMALTSITMRTGATLSGRALARNGAVTLDTNTITAEGCDDDTPPTDGPTTGPTPTDGPTGGPGGGGGAGDDDDNGNGGNGNGGNGNGGNGNGGNGNGGNNGGPGGGGGAGDDGVQVTEIPEGAVDTGQTGEATGPNRAVLTGSALAAGAGALALVAVRRRRSM